MAITRREFLKYSAVLGGGLMFGGLFDLAPVKAYAEANPPLWTAEALSVGVYCSGGCGVIVGKGTLPGYPGNEYVTYVQGNPDSPINGGGLCSKCQSSAQISSIVTTGGVRIPNPERITTPMWRGPGGTAWTPITWNQAIHGDGGSITGIKNLVYNTREAAGNFTETETVGGIPFTSNRCTGIACIGGSSLNNEPAYLTVKLMRALGVVYLETQARN